MKKHLVFYERFNIRENIIPKNWLKNKQGTYFLKTEIFMVRLPAPPPWGSMGQRKTTNVCFLKPPFTIPESFHISYFLLYSSSISLNAP